jgi:hypothetical protein
VNDHATNLRRLLASRATGNVPEDLLPWLIELATQSAPQEQLDALAPLDRLALEVSEVVDKWMTRRGLNTRTVSVSRRTLARCLKGQNVTIGTLADVADALDCDVAIDFKARPTKSDWGIYGTKRGIYGTTLFRSRRNRGNLKTSRAGAHSHDVIAQAAAESVSDASDDGDNPRAAP